MPLNMIADFNNYHNKKDSTQNQNKVNVINKKLISQNEDYKNTPNNRYHDENEDSNLFIDQRTAFEMKRRSCGPSTE